MFSLRPLLPSSCYRPVCHYKIQCRSFSNSFFSRCLINKKREEDFSNLGKKKISCLSGNAHSFSQKLLARNFSSMRVTSSQVPKIRVSSLSLSFGPKTIFDELELDLVGGDKIVLVGENGIGKSTLLKVLSRDLDSDRSEVYTSGSTGYLPQTLEDYSSFSAIEFFIEHAGSDELVDLLAKKKFLPEDEWMNEFNCLGGYNFFKDMGQLGLNNLDLNKKMQFFSGGEKTKILLSALSFSDPDILLLDEPTNHLDANGVNWLERFLRRHHGILIMTTHDRMLIDRTATGIAEISPETRKLVKFRGGYTAYLEQLEKERERLKGKFLRQQKELKTLKSNIDNLTSSKENQNFKSRKDSDKLSFNAHGQRKQKGKGRMVNQLKNKLESIEDNTVHVPKKRSEVSIDITEAYSGRKSSVSLESISKKIGSSILFSGVSFDLSCGQRLVVQGRNGTGKTTLLKIIAGIIPPDTGVVNLNGCNTVGFLDQEQETLDLDLTPIELLLSDSRISLSESTLVSKLTRFGIYRKEDLHTPLELLSIGCRRKAQLAQIILRGSDVLLLDEPTNHLDLPSLEHIEEQLLEFPGPIIAVSHDRYFIKKFATQRISLDS